MRIDITNEEVHKILSEYFKLNEGDAIRLNYSEPIEVWKSRVNYDEKIRYMESKLDLPKRINHHLWL